MSHRLNAFIADYNLAAALRSEARDHRMFHFLADDSIVVEAIDDEGLQSLITEREILQTLGRSELSFRIPVVREVSNDNWLEVREPVSGEVNTQRIFDCVTSDRSAALTWPNSVEQYWPHCIEPSPQISCPNLPNVGSDGRHRWNGSRPACRRLSTIHH
ncbi:MAG: hypothetical protein AAF525_04960 [Pseudomonadota bacterium]